MYILIIQIQIFKSYIFKTFKIFLEVADCHILLELL